MKSALKWLLALVTGAAIAVAAFIFLFPKGWKTEKPANAGNAEASNDTVTRLGYIKAAAVRSGGAIADRDFVREFRNYLQLEAESLNDHDKKLLAEQGFPRDVRDLAQFEAVQKLAMNWTSATGFPRNAEGLVINPDKIHSFKDVQNLLISSPQGHNKTTLAHQLSQLNDAVRIVQRNEWPFSGGRSSLIVRGAGFLAGSSEHLATANEEPPAWFPLFTSRDCALLYIRQGLENLPEILPKKRFGALYDDSGDLSLSQRLTPESELRIEQLISEERKAALAEVDKNPNSLEKEYQDAAGRERATKQINNASDAMQLFFRSYLPEKPSNSENTSSLRPATTPLPIRENSKAR